MIPKVKVVLIVVICTLGCSTTKIQSKNTIGVDEVSKEMRAYGQFVGVWDCEVSNLMDDGSWKTTKASWRFEYILDGTAVQDFWINPVDGSENPLQGTNIRIYNPEKGKWQCVWLENRSQSIGGVWESYEDKQGNIRLYDDTKAWLITFYNIDKDHFDWKWEFGQPDGSMKTMSKMTAVRIK